MLVNEGLCTRAESGTCSVCSAPCSSYIHLAAMESKVDDGFSGNTCRRNEADSCSLSGVNGPFFGNRSCDDRLHPI